MRKSRKRPSPVRGSIRKVRKIQPCGSRISASEKWAESALSTASMSASDTSGKRWAPPKWSYTTRAAEAAPASMMWFSGLAPTRTTSESWWSKARWTPGTYGRFVVMSWSDSWTLPSCMSFGCTNRMSSSIPSCFSRAAHTSPSKSERVTSRYRFAVSVATCCAIWILPGKSLGHGAGRSGAQELIGRCAGHLNGTGDSLTCASLRAWRAPRATSPPRSASPPSASRCPCSRTIFDPAGLRERTGALEARMGEPGFWDDPETAGKVNADYARMQRRLEGFNRLSSDAEDLESLAELAEEDPDLAAELAEAIASVEDRLAALEEQRLFTGRYDAGDALVTVNAGAGGTDAQDWAEMVLRMEMRWAERRGFSVELLEASPGEEAGIKSATFRVSGDNAYGLYAAEKGVHRLVRLSPFDSANRRQTSFAGVEVSPVVEEAGELEIDDDDLQIDTYRASGAGGQHVNKTDSAVRITHKPTGVVVQCQNERSQSSNKATAMAMLRSRLAELEERKRQEEIAKERGEAQDVNFGSQIRSYVLHPYTMVKDHRTDFEVGSAERVLDGDLDGFVRAWLEASAKAGR